MKRVVNRAIVLNILMLSLLLGMFSCGGNSTSQLIGVWKTSDLSSGLGTEIFRNMRADGRFTDEMHINIIQETEGPDMLARFVVLLDGTWSVRGKILTTEYDFTSGELKSFDYSFPDAPEDELDYYLEEYSYFEGYMQTEGLKVMLDNMPKGKQRFIRLNIKDNQFSYYTQEGSEVWTRVK
ncbi:hypothetical protein LJC06_00240 [Bacteroidales bacterium OttesenSCG-928-I14]|nr:hypothetical protein [Bacteroidales bacterium OttesenSCG-928-I14]